MFIYSHDTKSGMRHLTHTHTHTHTQFIHKVICHNTLSTQTLTSSSCKTPNSQCVRWLN